MGSKKNAQKQKNDIIKEREKIEAAFINDDGSIKEFLMMDDNIIENNKNEENVNLNDSVSLSI